MTGGVKLAAKGFKGHSHHGVSFGTDKVPVPLLRSLTFSAVQRWELWFTYNAVAAQDAMQCKADPAPEVCISEIIFGLT